VARHFSLVSLLLLSASAGCVTSHGAVCAHRVSAYPRGAVLSADGAGGWEATSEALQSAVEEAGLSLYVEPVDWSHGFGRVFSDQMDFGHAQCEGQRLAGRIAALRREHPEWDIYLVGHSAGCAVVLSAAGDLPANTVKRVVLLAPSVSADYDLRPALRGSRDGIDVFFSSRDVFYLGLGVAVTGTADRRWSSPAAGRTGFRPILEGCQDAPLYAKLRQHGWDPCVEWTGNRGGHYDAYKSSYLRSYVLPLLN
jgi:pimeloyl-ACP methyl ester carboxylesterase